MTNIYKWWILIILSLILIGWLFFSIRYGNLAVEEVLIINVFFIIAYFLYLINYIRFNKS
ncbi:MULTISPECIES: hypothetical protein [Staphylococcus]|uniref:Uncharacterized protein n=1 Tax=Staphylococcus capitis TaxID=29388 RepID=A0A848EVX2_STACP|nr:MULTISPECIES: hypothetical protein [Staphylococcus]MBE7341709.1 hypothetical protein [Staphylococcus haemolyticus]MBM6086584.1 hypothetical protein [Staphylococcus epidermidis]MBM6094085.1 hypothetical protein [Staphylococcus epidermidis]MBM6140181.1 hypothetical protein [Staphylococcus epidermidis]MBM6204538.1 hypothetical protein [Staphylococcus epidermidis]